MKAKLIIMLAGDPMREIGEVVDGDEALRFVEAGFAIPVVDEMTQPERATRKATSTETR